MGVGLHSAAIRARVRAGWRARAAATTAACKLFAPGVMYAVRVPR